MLHSDLASMEANEHTIFVHPPIMVHNQKKFFKASGKTLKVRGEKSEEYWYESSLLGKSQTYWHSDLR